MNVCRAPLGIPIDGAAQSLNTLDCFPIEEVERFVLDALTAANVRHDIAELTARGLVNASERGVDSHGIWLLPHYVAGVRGGRINPAPKMRFERTGAATGRLDADHTFGHPAAMLGMRRAMGLARDAGVGHVSVYNSSHCGALAWIALEACREDMIGLAFTHATARVRTPNATQPFFGNNPICLAAPMDGEEPFCFDAATTSIAFNKVRQYQAAGIMLPPGVGADAQGRETTDPASVAQLLPIGDYKGFGLSMVVDIFCGLLTGMPAGPEVSKMFEDPMSKPRLLGHYVIAIRVDLFDDPDRFRRRLRSLAEAVRNEPRLDASIPIQVPGDPEKRRAAERRTTGIPIGEPDLRALTKLANELGIRPLVRETELPVQA